MTSINKPIEVMKRYEMKYVLSPGQTAFLKERLMGRMYEDRYGLTSIASLYYDTPDRRLIRASMEKPLFKEKIRLRSYGIATNSSPVYLELKRKTDSIVYKRRVSTTIPNVNDFFAGKGEIGKDGQISREISYFRDYYKELVPSCLIIYDRVAYYEKDGDLRLTIDHDPRFRTRDLDLTTSMEGESLLPPGNTILEIKVQEAMPLWLSTVLAEGEIYKTSFSKYGEAYKRQALKRAE